MKKIILFILLFCATKSFAQFPINAAQGTQTTTVLTRGISASDSGYWYRTAFADTTALNRGRIDEIAGVVARTSDNSLWLRNNTATRWIQLSGGSGSVNIYNSDGTQTGNRIVTGGGYTLAFDAQSSIRLQPSGSNRTSLLYMDIDSIRLEPPFGILTIDSLASGASTDSVLVWTQATGRVKKRSYSSFTPTWQQTLTAGSTLTGDNTIAGGGFDFTWNALGKLALGVTNTASGTQSVAIGESNTASNLLSLAIGYNNTSSGSQTSAAIGTSNTASGQYSIAIGNSNISSALSSLALGSSTTASAVAATSMGGSTIASGQYSLAAGQSDTASGRWSTAFGGETKASADYSFAQGHESKATGVASIAIGNGVVSSGYNATTFGRTYTNSKDTSFAFGVAGATGLGARILELTRDSAIISPTVATLISSSLQYSAGSPGAGKVLTSDASGNATWSTAPSALTIPISSLTAATGTNSITVGHPQTWNYNGIQSTTGHTFTSNSITSGTIMDITGISSFLAAGNEGLNIGISGANATNGITATGARISVTNTNATSGTNVALDLTASGATTANYALITNGGNVGIGTSTPTSLLHVNGVAQIGTAGSTLGQILMSGNTSGTVTLQPAAAAGTWTLTLPDNDGDANQVLTTNGSGVTSWATASGGSPAGNFGNLQLNRNSAFATPASDSLDFESATGLSVKGDVRTTTSLYLPSSSSEGLRFGTTVRMYDNGSLMRISPTAGTMQMFTSGSNFNLQMYNSAGDSYFNFAPLSGTGSSFETAGSATNLKMQQTSAHTLMIGNGTAVAKTNILSTTEQLRLMYDASNYVAHTVSSAGVYTVAPTGASVTVTKPVVLKNYTVATLPTGVQGMICYVTDATAPTYGATLVGGGAVVTMAFFDGTNWTAH